MRFVVVSWGFLCLFPACGWGFKVAAWEEDRAFFPLGKYAEPLMSPTTASRLEDEKALLDAAERGETSLVLSLLQSGVDPSAGNSGALFSAAYHGYDAIAEALIVWGVAFDARRGEGHFTALHVALQEGHWRVVELLLAGGADINDRTKNGSTPLIVAIKERHWLTIKLLVYSGADIHAKTEGSLFTALHVASEVGHVKAVNLLLKKGADIDAQTDIGCTPLMIAAILGHELIVEALLEAGADTSLQTAHGATSRAFAITYGYPHIAARVRPRD